MLKEVVEKVKDYLGLRQQNYQITFAGEQAQAVLADLARFCRANESTFHPDPYIRCQLDGRREVWLRIEQHLKLSPDQLWKIYGRNVNA